MGRTTKTITISLPPEMLAQIEEAMRKEGRTKSELLREALRHYLEWQKWRELQRYGSLKATQQEIAEGQIEDIVDACRE